MNNTLLLKRIDELCAEKGVNKTTAFTESHVGKNFASNLKTANPSQKNLALLAEYFNCTIEYLTGESDYRGSSISQAFVSDQLTTEERILIDAYRSASVEGKFHIIQTCMNEKDSKGENKVVG